MKSGLFQEYTNVVYRFHLGLISHHGISQLLPDGPTPLTPTTKMFTVEMYKSLRFISEFLNPYIWFLYLSANNRKTLCKASKIRK